MSDGDFLYQLRFTETQMETLAAALDLLVVLFQDDILYDHELETLEDLTAPLDELVDNDLDAEEDGEQIVELRNMVYGVLGRKPESDDQEPVDISRLWT